MLIRSARRHSRLGVWLLTALSLSVRAGSASAQWFTLPFDARQGLMIGADRPYTPYQFDVALSPGVDFEYAQLNAVVAPTYLNPKWDLGFGASASALLPFGLRDIGFRVSLQGLYLPFQNDARIALGLGFEALTLLRLYLWPGYDVEAERVFLTASIGFDVVNLVRVLRGPEETVFPVEPAPIP